MKIENIAVIKTSELTEAQMGAIRDITYPADHEGDIWFTEKNVVRSADAGLADDMAKAGVTSAIIIDDVNANSEVDPSKQKERVKVITIAVIKTSNLSDERIAAVRDIVIAADHGIDYHLLHKTELRAADAQLADDMVMLGVDTVIIADDATAEKTVVDLNVTS